MKSQFFIKFIFSFLYNVPTEYKIKVLVIKTKSYELIHPVLTFLNTLNSVWKVICSNLVVLIWNKITTFSPPRSAVLCVSNSIR